MRHPARFMMSDVSGDEFRHAQTRRPDRGDIPVFLVSGAHDLASRAEALNAARTCGSRSISRRCCRDRAQLCARSRSRSAALTTECWHSGASVGQRRCTDHTFSPTRSVASAKRAASLSCAFPDVRAWPSGPRVVTVRARFSAPERRRSRFTWTQPSGCRQNAYATEQVPRQRRGRSRSPQRTQRGWFVEPSASTVASLLGDQPFAAAPRPVVGMHDRAGSRGNASLQRVRTRRRTSHV